MSSLRHKQPPSSRLNGLPHQFQRRATAPTSASIAAGASGSSSMSKNASSVSLVTSLSPAASLPSPTPSAPRAITSLASNRPANSQESLFQICLLLIKRLSNVPGLHQYLLACKVAFDEPIIMAPLAPSDLEILATRSKSISSTSDSATLTSPDRAPASTLASTTDLTALHPSLAARFRTVAAVPYGDPVDPVTHLWQFLRMGTSLCALYNALDPPIKLAADLTDDIKVAKRALYHFIQACKSELLFPDDKLFTISDVYSDSTSVLIKILPTLRKILDSLEQKGIIPNTPSTPAKRDESDQRAKVVEELLQTERKYVQDLQVLADYQAVIQEANLMDSETMQFLFPNIPVIVDFQRRFLVGMEYQALLPPQEQRFGQLFEEFELGFINCYEGYSVNHKSANEIIIQETPKLLAYAHIIEPTYELSGMLIKPVQRICKYPLLIKELIKSTPSDFPYYPELVHSVDAVKHITENVNESQRRAQNQQKVRELNDRMRDWRGHYIEEFGDLLHFGVYPVVKVGFEREYHLYLFETILLCCKEAPTASKRLPVLSRRSNGASEESKRSSIVLKGRIYLNYITDISTTKSDGYLLHISWGVDDASDTGYFDIRFPNDEDMTRWESTLRRLTQSQNARQNGVAPGAKLNGGPNYDELDDDDEDMKQSDVDNFDDTSSRRTSRDEFDDDTESVDSDAASSRLGSTWSNYTFQGGYDGLTDDTHNLSLNGSTRASREGSTVSVNSSTNHAFGPVFGQRSISDPRGRSASMSNGIPASANSSVSSLISGPAVALAHQQAQKQHMQGTRMRSESTVLGRGPPSRSAINSQDSSTSLISGKSPVSSTATTPISAAPVKTHPNQLKVKLHYLDDTFLLMVPNGIDYQALLDRVDRKIRLCGKQAPNPLRIKYKDEDDDFVTITSNEDIQMALEQEQEAGGSGVKSSDIVTIWAA